MSISKRKVIIISSIIFLCAFLVFLYTHFLAKNKIVLDEHSELLSIWVEDSSGNFQVANSFPGAGYILDLNHSKCENGGTLSGDGTGVTLTANKTDKCYLYFIQPWINVNATKTLTCNSSLKTWDNKINGASFSVSSDADLTCTATKTMNSTSQNFASYIMSLAGTTQGTGQVVHETSNIEFPVTSSGSVPLTSSEVYYSTPFYSTSASGYTTAGTEEASAMSLINSNGYAFFQTNPSIVGKRYHYTIRVNKSGNYGFCYRRNGGGTENTISIYVYNTIEEDWIRFANAVVLDGTQELCYDLGFVDSNINYVKIVQDVINEVAQITLALGKPNSLKAYDHGYHYEGKNPNNYIWFNNELWRIIGVFDEDRHGIENSNLVKIIRNSSIGSYAWNGVDGYPNDWPNSTLYRMLNGCYFYAKKGTDTSDISGSSVECNNYCIGNFTNNIGTALNNCDFNVNGIQGSNDTFSYRDMVQNVTWYLGGPGKTSWDITYPANVYGFEVTGKTLNSNRSLSINGYVGLMYLSDYGYSVLSSSCSRQGYTVKGDDANSYAISSCSNQSWLFSESFEWMLTPGHKGSNSAHTFTVQSEISTSYAYYSHSVRPVVYLKKNIYRISGNGTISNPYIVGMA